MKKLAILLTALLLCCGCDEKKQDEDLPEEKSETAVSSEVTDIPAAGESRAEDAESHEAGGEAVTEQGFRSYDASEFKEIQVSISPTEKEAPVKIESIKIPEIDFGERIAPCKTSGDPLLYDPSNEFPTSTSEGNDSIYKLMLDMPEKGIVTHIVKSRSKLYMIVDYDINCTQCHEWTLNRYDIETKEITEIYSYSGTEDVSGEPLNIVVAGNKMLFTSIDSVQHKGAIKEIDLEAGTCETICEPEAYPYLINGGDNKVKILFADDTSDLVISEITLKEYDTETGEFTTVTEKEQTKAYSVAPGEYSAYLRMPRKAKNCEVISDDYSLDLGIKSASLLYASNDEVIVVSDDLNLHTFNFAKMEHYVTPVGKYSGSSEAYNGNIILMGGYADPMCRMCCFMPELGLSFDISDQIEDVMRQNTGFEMSLLDNLYYNGETVVFNFDDRMTIPVEGGYGYNVISPKIVNWIESVE